jgi:glycosyltransferase involved in cell wall biosynthesis
MGEWIAFLDSDDEWLPSKLQKQMIIAKKTGCLAVCSNAIREMENGKRKILYFNFPERNLTLGNLFLTNYIICSSMLLHYSLLEKTGNFPEDSQSHGVEDYSLWLKVAAITTIAYISKPLVIYHDQPETGDRSQVTKNYFQMKYQTMKNLVNWWLKTKNYK